jgi:hypothetical protein
MTEQTVEPPTGDVLGIGQPDGSHRDAKSNRRALWVSVAAIGALSALSFPVAMHFAHHAPAAPRVPDHIAGLTIDTTADASGTADYLRSAIAAGLGLDHAVGAVYTADGTAGAQGDARAVIYAGGTTTKGTDASQVTGLLNLMRDSTDGVDAIVTEAPGSVGGLMKCGLTTDTDKTDAGADNEMAVCAFAHSGTVGIALFPNRTVEQAADLMRSIQPALTAKN